MIRYRVGLLLLMLLGTAASRADDRSLAIDGVYWHSLTTDEKVHFIQGFIVGNNIGFGLGKYLGVNALIDIPGVKGARAEAAMHTANTVDATPYTFGQLKDGIDECYKDFRNRDLDVDVCFSWAVSGIRGDDDQSRKNFLDLSRQAAAQAKQ